MRSAMRLAESISWVTTTVVTPTFLFRSRMSSSISALVGGEYQTHYTPTKAGLHSLMQSAAIALGRHNIRCNSLLPGTILTEINKEDLADQEKRDHMEGRIPLGRLGVPEDMVGPTVFLASDMARYVTGAALLVDGGAFVNLQ